MKTVILCIILIIFFFYLVFKGADVQTEKARECEEKGGYALMERGIFKDCFSGVKIIK